MSSCSFTPSGLTRRLARATIFGTTPCTAMCGEAAKELLCSVLRRMECSFGMCLMWRIPGADAMRGSRSFGRWMRKILLRQQQRWLTHMAKTRRLPWWSNFIKPLSKSRKIILQNMRRNLPTSLQRLLQQAMMKMPCGGWLRKASPTCWLLDAACSQRPQLLRAWHRLQGSRK